MYGEVKPLNLSADFIDRIVTALEHSNHPDNDTRKGAEEILREAKEIPGYVTCLLKISRDPSYAASGKYKMDINLAAAIQLGTFVSVHWIIKSPRHAEEQSSKDFKYVFI